MQVLLHFDSEGNLLQKYTDTKWDYDGFYTSRNQLRTLPLSYRSWTDDWEEVIVWTPTTEYIRDSYDEVNRPFVRYSEEEFDRWLAAHDREVAEKAWDEGFMRANRLVNCRMCRGTTVPKINPYTV